MKRKFLAILAMLLAVSVLPVEARGVANGLPDIAVTSLEISPNPGKIGDAGIASFAVSYDNNGKKALSSNCTVELRLDDVFVFSSGCNGLRSGEIRTYTAPIAYSIVGSHNVKVVASMNRDRIGTNNIKEATLVIKDLPNLKVIDFRCAGGHCPEQPIVSDSVGFQWSVQNIGAAIEGATITATVTMNGDVVSVKTYDNRYIFNGGFDGDGVLIPNLYYKPGTYTFKLNISLSVKESDPFNTAEFTVEVVPLPPAPGLPDLTNGGTNFEWTATRPQDVIVHYIVENIGDVASPPANIGISIDGRPYSIRTVGSIPSFSKTEDTFVVPAYLIGGSDPSPGMFHTMDITIDPGNLIEEKREDNNHRGEMICYPYPFGLQPWCGQLPPNPLLSDITLSYISVEQTDPGTIKVNHYLKNNGPGILDGSVGLKYSTDVFGAIQTIRSTAVDAVLGPGEGMVVSQTFSANDMPSPFFPSGYYHLWIEADWENQIPETDENNNILIVPICLSAVMPGSSCYPPPTPTPTPTSP